jgi:hypothetical protein
VLVECGLLRVEVSGGTEATTYRATCRPSFGRIAALGSPEQIVAMYVALHGPQAEAAAADVLAGLCDPEDLEALPALIGELEPAPVPAAGSTWAPYAAARLTGGAMPGEERVILARHLMQHGIVGKAKPNAKDHAERGKFSARFDASEYIAAARVHLGMSADDAQALSMTEFQQLMEAKFPERGAGALDVPTREEYEAGMRAFEELRQRRAAGKADHG